MAKILIVDDDAAFSEMLEAFFQNAGHQTARTNGPAGAAEAIKAGLPDLVVMDMQMPGGGAPAALNLMQAVPGAAGLPIIFCSGMPVEQVHRWFPAAPNRRFLPKPVDAKALVQQARELLGEGERARAAQEAYLQDPMAVPRAQIVAGHIAEFLGKVAKGNSSDVATEMVDWMLRDAVEANVSDIHLVPERDSTRILYRIDGWLLEQGRYPKASQPLVPRLRIMSGLQPTAPSAMTPEEGGFDVAVQGRTVRARFATMPSTFGERVTIRLLRGAENLGLGRLGLAPEDLARLRAVIRSNNGIFFVSGATGAGKTTSICSMLKDLSGEPLNIITLEDPVEYQLPGVTHTQVNPKFGFSFADGLRAVLRQDPNVIMVGEVRDLETAEIALRAATSGHLILSTIHAMNAVNVIARLVGIGADPFMISCSMLGSMTQRLVRSVCSQCAQPDKPSEPLLQAALKRLPAAQAEEMRAALASAQARLVRGRGCAACGGSGYRGRTGIFELLIVTPEVRETILSRKDESATLAAAYATGFSSLMRDAMRKAAAGLVVFEDAVRAAV